MIVGPGPEGPPAPGPGPAADEAGRRSLRAGVVMMASQAALLAMGLGSTMILARLLGPEDFGLVAMALTFVAFVGVFNDFGIPMAALRDATLGQGQASTLFWLGAGLGLLVAAATLAAGPAIARFYGEPRLAGIFPLMAVVFLAVGLGALPQGLLKRRMRFGALTTAELAGTAAGLCSSIALAAWGAGYWALAAQYPIAAATRTALLWRACRWRPSAPSPLSEIRGLVSFGGDVTLYRVVNHLGKHLDRILIGYSGGEGALGIYSAADRWAMYPVSQVYPPLLGVAVAGLGRVRDDPGLYRRSFVRAYAPLLAVILPAQAFMFAESRPFVLVLLGPRWVESAPLLRILLVGAFAAGLTQFTKWIYLVEGRTRDQLRWGLVGSLATAAAVAVAARSGVTAVATAFSAATCVTAVPATFRCLGGSALTAGDVLAACWRPTVASVSAAALLMAVGPAAAAPGPAAELAAGAAIYAIAFGAAWVALPGGYRSARAMLALVGEARRPPPPPGDQGEPGGVAGPSRSRRAGG